MKTLVKFVVIMTILGVGGWMAYSPVAAYWKERTKIRYRQAPITQGGIVSVVNSTGKIEPVRSVQIGAFVSGPILKVFVDFNSEVKEGDLLATIDPRVYDSNASREKANLATRKADVQRVTALLQQAKNDEKRSISLRQENKEYISDTEMDQFKFNRLSLEAQLVVAEAAVDQAQASLDNALVNVVYTEIRSPVDGIVIDSKVNPGQTLAAQFQTPELFVVAPGMRERMNVLASVDEADIGLINEAQAQKQPVKFTVDAYPDDLFNGEISQVRKSSTTTQNVVTYPVIVGAPNPDLKLMPGMTANISFQIGEVKDVPRIPNEALRFYPATREQVRPQDRALLDGQLITAETKEDSDVAAAKQSAMEKAELRKQRNRRHVWVVDGDFLRAVEVVTGLSDNKYTEIVSGDLKVGQTLVIGVAPRELTQ